MQGYNDDRLQVSGYEYQVVKYKVTKMRKQVLGDKYQIISMR